MTIYRLLIGVFAVSTIVGCAEGLLHRVDQQQGNLVTDRMIEQLKPGMNREQVVFIMGQPILKNSFDSDRWDYIYTFAPRSQTPEKRYITLYFEDGLLTRLVGNYEKMESDVEADQEDSLNGIFTLSGGD
ncbi:MAG: outer membrane protein assembly factor BamE [Gammaproteobacteria bacterium]|nr:outer membrane protein assembly factor BamE [Gammaproteobacteria bacterium]